MGSPKHFILSFLVILHSVRTVSCVHVFNYTLCKRKDFSSDSFVCVCSETYCDGFNNKASKPLSSNEFAVYTSSKDGARFELKIGQISPHFNKRKDAVFLHVDETLQYQEIVGFGGAFTDAATINIKNLSNILQESLINSYYSPNGIEYTLGRIPMASCDFSTRIYTYDDVPGDFNLTNFKLAPEDVSFKIPVIKAAVSQSKRQVKFFASPWSAPAWLKNSNSTVGGELMGSAGDKYHKTWAKYFVKFLEAYEKNGVKVQGVTVQNEPITGYIPGYTFQSMGFTGSTERDFVKSDLGPALEKAGYGDIKLMIFDDNRITLPGFTETVLSDKDAMKYVSGVAVHWYEDSFLPASFLTHLHNKLHITKKPKHLLILTLIDSYPDTFVLATEACTGFSSLETRGPVLGSWERGERYSHSVIEDFQHWVVGWTDWNLALNMQGGPNWVKNFVDSPIIVDFENNAFYKQPMFYHLGHFSKFVKPGSLRIDISPATSTVTGLEYIAFLLRDNSTCAVILNRSKMDVKVTLSTGVGYILGEIKASSIQTYLWQ